MTGSCPAITMLAKPGAASCTVECRACTCLARVLGAMRPPHAQTKDRHDG